LIIILFIYLFIFHYFHWFILSSYDIINDVFKMVIYSAVESPWVLDSPNLTSLPNELFEFSSSIENLTCPESEEDCVQESTFLVTNIRTASICSFGGNYSFSWALTAPGYEDETYETLDITIISTNVCGSIQVHSSVIFTSLFFFFFFFSYFTFFYFFSFLTLPFLIHKDWRNSSKLWG